MKMVATDLVNSSMLSSLRSMQWFHFKMTDFTCGVNEVYTKGTWDVYKVLRLAGGNN